MSMCKECGQSTSNIHPYRTCTSPPAERPRKHKSESMWSRLKRALHNVKLSITRACAGVLMNSPSWASKLADNALTFIVGMGYGIAHIAWWSLKYVGSTAAAVFGSWLVGRVMCKTFPFFALNQEHLYVDTFVLGLLSIMALLAAVVAIGIAWRKCFELGQAKRQSKKQANLTRYARCLR